MQLKVRDCGDVWEIQSATASAGGSRFKLDIRKRDATIINRAGPTDALDNSAIAEQFAGALLENRNGEAELTRQSPLIAQDNGDSWLVRGGGNIDTSAEGPGAFTFEAQKSDGCVLDSHSIGY
jgi:hypothetical protein